jgi:hypothetical protein
MTEQSTPRIFISYALKYGAPLAKRLRERFLAENLSAFHSLPDLYAARNRDRSGVDRQPPG